MKKLIVLMIVMFVLSISSTLFAADKMTGKDLAVKVDERVIAKDMVAEMTMNIIDKKGKVRSRKVKTTRKGDDFQLMRFMKPANIKGTGFLMIAHDDKDDDMWIYLPAFGKVRRIASSSKKGNFMGTDFTYEDMGERKVNDYSYKILREEKVNGKEYWVLESTPLKDDVTDYSKIETWVWKTYPAPVMEKFYDKSGELKKEKKMEMEKNGKYWLPVKMEMKNISSGGKTEITFEKTIVDTGIKDSKFTQNELKKAR